MDGHKILERLSTPIVSCRICTCKVQMHEWQHEPNPQLEDYFVQA